MLTAFEDVLQNKALTSLFQPMVDLRNGAIVGYEGLIRGPCNTELYSPLVLFELAKAVQKTQELEHLCCEIHSARFSELGLSGKLFLNSSPCLLHPVAEFVKKRSSLTRGTGKCSNIDIVIELTERAPTQDYAQLREVVLKYRDLGIQFAIDDLGEGFASLKLWSELKPEYVKIDQYFIRGIGSDLLKQQFVRSIGEIAQQAQATVIAEGIETIAELIELRRLGVQYGQGFYLAVPQANPPTKLSDSISAVFKSPFGTQLPNVLMRADRPITARRLLREAPAVPDTTSTNDVCERFQNEPALDTLVVLRAGLPVGLIRRDRLFDRLARLFHRELYGNRACGDILENAPLIVDRDTSLHELGQLVAEGPQHYMADGFIITRNGGYLGVGSSLELMREISQLQLRAARYANPLTQLPGNVPVNEHIELLLRGTESFAVCYGDLDNFKPFNDLYGYRKGDDVIQITANIFTEHSDPELDFVGHVGGDDFIVIFRSRDWEERCKRVITHLPLALNYIYREEHRREGGYVAENRQLVKVFHPLVSLSLGVVEINPVHLYSGVLIAEMATAAKARAKQMFGSSLFVERRQPLEPVGNRLEAAFGSYG